MKKLLAAASLAFLLPLPAHAEAPPQDAKAAATAALTEGMKLIRDNQWDAWIKNSCSPSKLCFNDNSKKSLKTYNLPAVQRRSKACLKAGDKVVVTRTDETGPDELKLFIQCEETAMPVPFRLGKEGGKWLFRSL